MRSLPAATAALLLVLLAGCSDDRAAEPSPEPQESAAPMSAFAQAVNTRCDQLAQDSVAITGGGSPEVAQFNVDQPKLQALSDAFDADVAKIPVTTAEDRTAADAFRAYQRFSDTEYAKVIAVAKAGDQQKFDDAFDAFLSAFGSSPVPAALDAVAISCPAR